MSCKFLVNKKFIKSHSGRILYKGFVFDGDNIYYPEIIQLFNGVDFSGNKELNITNRFRTLLDNGLDLDEVVSTIKKELKYEERLCNTIKPNICYFNIVNQYSKPSVIKAVKSNATAYFCQVNYYLEDKKNDYNNSRIEDINNIIINTNRNNRLWALIEKNLKLNK